MPNAESAAGSSFGSVYPTGRVVIVLWIRRSGETWSHETSAHRLEEAVITAIVAAVLFAVALLLHLAKLSLGPLDVTFFWLAGLVCVGLHLAGIGTSRRAYSRRR